MAAKGWHKVVALPWATLTRIPLTLFAGVVVADFWGWFIATTFGLAPISYLQAIGLLLFVGLFKMGLKMETPEKNDSPIATMFIMQFAWAFIWLVTWGIGAVWSLFI